MSGDQPVSSFGDPDAQPPTPKQTPTSSIFPSPRFETPKNNSGRFDESGGWTPHFAEEYSVFHSTPGNLRGSQGLFASFGPATPYLGSAHKRALSSGETFSPTTNTLQLPSVEPSEILRSSPSQLSTPTFQQSTPTSRNPETTERSSKKVRRGTVVEEPQGQTVTPPPSARKGERTLAPKLDAAAMQNDQGFGHPDFLATAQPQMGSFVTNTGDMFSYPLSAPAGGPGYAPQRSFWDQEPSMDPNMGGMDVDFSANGANGGDMFQSQATSHQPLTPVDWPNANMMQAQNVTVDLESSHVTTRDHQAPLISQAPMPALVTSAAEQAMFAVHYPTTMEDAFGMNSTGGAVNPGLIFSRPQSANIDTMSHDQSMQVPIAPRPQTSQDFIQPTSRAPSAQKIVTTARGELRRSSSARNVPSSRPDRALASSPIKSVGRPGLTRSFSENRGKKQSSRPALPVLAPAPRPQSQLINNAGVGANRPIINQSSRPSGRSSPLKSQQHSRLSSLTSIPETSGPRMRTQAKFTIDANGRARVETTVVVETDEPTSAKKRHSSHSGTQRRRWTSSDEEDDDSSTDDEGPIIIPSRNTSFALPDPVKPSIIHPFHRATSASYTTSFQRQDDDSDGETVVNVNDLTPTGKVPGDAVSELQKVREARQRSGQWPPASASKPKRSFSVVGGSGSASFGNGGGYRGSYDNSSLSPASMTEVSLPTPTGERGRLGGGGGMRCVCGRWEVGRNELLVQCQSCEMNLHERCVNATETSIYICPFCANVTPSHHARGGRVREREGDRGSYHGHGRVGGGGSSGLGITSPLAHKSFKSFR
ncbi:hypothetical protein QBC40DRAFT_313399 [Triangularia verruculosa]|uniref:Zinc finger PHD-type domain-containing protein n=1 Tax=Triangularia verruculosa TaxID=2587418 RepID=A0AAN6XEV5_9PEZI|nr:hypothetical protein QBC40DRAFT_313399 [Triangularia verruculosa]